MTYSRLLSPLASLAASPLHMLLLFKTYRCRLPHYKLQLLKFNNSSRQTNSSKCLDNNSKRVYMYRVLRLSDLASFLGSSRICCSGSLRLGNIVTLLVWWMVMIRQDLLILCLKWKLSLGGWNGVKQLVVICRIWIYNLCLLSWQPICWLGSWAPFAVQVWPFGTTWVCAAVCWGT